MTRKEFLQKSALLSVGLPFFSSFLTSCGKEDEILANLDLSTDYTGKVLIIGAGVAGMTAGYFLSRYNVDFEIIEASSNMGGRVKRAEGFADFPIDLGAEWIHDDPETLAGLLKDSSLDANIDFVVYNPQSIYNWNKEKLRKQNWARNFYSEHKFKNTTWYGFFEKYMAPHFMDQLNLNSPVSEIDYSGDKVVVRTTNNQTFEGDKVIVTVPIKILQNNAIQFTPSLPTEKTDAINSISMEDGLKVFIEFSERFYPDVLLFGGLINALSSDSKTYYDAAFRKDSNRNIMGLFVINEQAAEYTNLGGDEAIIERVLEELDEIFDGKASKTYMKHIVQNWSKEPYIQGSYSYEFYEGYESTMDTISKPLNNKVYFAGEALSKNMQATVHGASESAYLVVEQIVSG